MKYCLFCVKAQMKYFYINSKIRLLNKRVFLSPKQDYDIPNMGEVD
jgi:hypothetical protein